MWRLALDKQVVAVAVSLLVATSFAQERPSALLAFEAERAGVVTGRIAWTMEDAGDLPGREFQFFSTYAANGDRMLEARGDQDGWVAWNARTQKPVSRFPMRLLQNTEGIWRHAETSLRAELWRHKGESAPDQGNAMPDGNEFMDVRRFGAVPDMDEALNRGVEAVWRIGEAHNGSVELPLQDVRWSQTEHNGIFEVVGALADGTSTTWTIDSKRGWNVTRTSLIAKDGTVARETTCELREFDGVWFPSDVQVFESGKLKRRVRVREAKLNQPDDPESLPASVLGMEVGGNVNPQNFSVGSGNEAILFWDGERGLKLSEFKAAIKSGRIDYGPTIKAKQRGEDVHSPYMTQEDIVQQRKRTEERRLQGLSQFSMTDWERYVREFINKFELNGEQTQKAQLILDECRGAAKTLLDVKKDAFVQAQKSIDSARSSGDTRLQAKANEQLAELRRPINDIFERRLKPRLDTLPTSAQRKAADARASTQPATSPAPSP